MAELPDLLNLTANVSKASYLERMIGRNAASYKYYWLRAIVDEVAKGNESVNFIRLVARMIALAWYPVIYYHLNLGASDKLASIINYLHDTYELPNDCSQTDIIEAIELEGASDRKLAKLLEDRTRNVTYRLIRPFYEKGIAEARRTEPNWYDTMTDNVIFQLNQQDSAECLYSIHTDKQGLTINPEWAAFISDNLQVINGWLDFRLVQYLQARNPSVPAISSKLKPPVQRNLSAATQYWRKAIDVCRLREIYSGSPFTAESFDQYGALSIDHFVPWSFVLHDEPWNLVPMFKNMNSSKGDRLPSLDKFLEPFCAQQFQAFLAVRNADACKKVIESYYSIDPHVGEYIDSSASLESFSNSLKKTITPLYQIALNQGYSLWQSEAAS